MVQIMSFHFSATRKKLCNILGTCARIKEGIAGMLPALEVMGGCISY